MAIFDWIDEEEYEFWQKQRKADRRAQDAEASRRYAQPGPFDDGFQQAQRMEPLRTLQPAPMPVPEPEPVVQPPPARSQGSQPYGQPGPFDVAAMPQGRVRRTDEPLPERPSVMQPAGDILGNAWQAARAQKKDLLTEIGDIARELGHDDDGARAAQAIARTEGALEGAVGDTNLPGGGSYGPYQFYKKYGMMPAYARDLGMTEDQAGEYARANPQHAARWALQGYLGQAIKEGQAKGLRGADLATYAQTYGQRSQSPERAGQNYQAMFGGSVSPVMQQGQAQQAPLRTLQRPAEEGRPERDPLKEFGDNLFGGLAPREKQRQPERMRTIGENTAPDVNVPTQPPGGIASALQGAGQLMGNIPEPVADALWQGALGPLGQKPVRDYLGQRVGGVAQGVGEAAQGFQENVSTPFAMSFFTPKKLDSGKVIPALAGPSQPTFAKDLLQEGWQGAKEKANERFGEFDPTAQFGLSVLADPLNVAGLDPALLLKPALKGIGAAAKVARQVAPGALSAAKRAGQVFMEGAKDVPVPGMAPEATGAVLGGAYGLATDDPTLSDRERVSEFLQKTAGGGLGARILTKGMKGIRPGLTVEDVGKAPTAYVQARKQAGTGKYELFYRGTRNKVELTEGELFDSPKQATATYEARWYKERQAVPTEAPPAVQAATPEPLATKQPWEMTFGDIDARYPQVRDTVDGRQVGQAVPNMTSIDSSLDNPTTLEGVRDVPISMFEDSGPPKFQSATEKARTERLAEQIRQSGRVDPLIVVDDAQSSPYILEGAHRFDALKLLGAKSFPAKVVIDEDAYYNAAKQALSEGKPVPDEVLKDYPELVKAAPESEALPVADAPYEPNVRQGAEQAPVADAASAPHPTAIEDATKQFADIKREQERAASLMGDALNGDTQAKKKLQELEASWNARGQAAAQKLSDADLQKLIEGTQGSELAKYGEPLPRDGRGATDYAAREWLRRAKNPDSPQAAYKRQWQIDSHERELKRFNALSDTEKAEYIRDFGDPRLEAESKLSLTEPPVAEAPPTAKPTILPDFTVDQLTERKGRFLSEANRMRASANPDLAELDYYERLLAIIDDALAERGVVPKSELKPPLTEPEPIKETAPTLTQEATTPPIASVDDAVPTPEGGQPAEVRPRRPTMAERYEQWKATQPQEPAPAAAAGAPPPPEPPQGPPPTLPSGRQPGGPQNIRPYTPPDPYQQLQDALKPETQSLGQQLGERFNAFMRAMYDRNYDLGALEKATGIPTHKLAQVVSGAVAAGEDRVRRFVLPIVEPLGKDVRHLEEYMVLMRNGDILARNPSAQLPGGIPGWPGVIEAEKRLQARIGPERFAAVKAAAEQMWKVNDELILKALVDEGMLSKDSYRAIKSAHPHYIDFHRADFSLTDTVERGLVRPEANVSNLGIKQMELAGSQRKLDQPLARTEAQIIRTRVLISRNRAARGIVEALQALEKEVPEVQRRVRLLSSKEAAEHSNVTDTISFFKDGQKVVYQVPPQFASIAKHVEAEMVGGWWRLASQVLGASVLRKGAVQYNPLFLIVNPMRDAVGAFFREGLVPMSPDYIRGWVAAITQNSTFTDAAEAGVLMSGIVDTMRSTEALSRASGLGKIQVKSWEDALWLVPRLIQQRAWGDLLKLPPRLIERANIVGEQATRIATYAKLRGQGIGELEAAIRARDVSVDFAKSGNVMKLINQMIPFSNAGLQGASNTVRLFKDNPKQALLASSVLAMPSIAAYTWNQRYESSKKIPEYEYINFWVLQVGEGTKNADPKYPDQPAEKFPVYIRIPKGPAGAFLTAPVEMALRLAEAKGDASAQDQLLKGAWTMARSLSPIEPNLSGIVPPVGGTAIGISTGQDLFRGQKIVPRREELRPAELQYGSETSDVAVALGERFQMSPRMIEWAIKDVGAGVASQTMWVSDLVLNSLGYNPQAPGEIKRQALTETEAISRNPIAGRFVGTRGTAEESANWDRFNKLVEDTNRAYTSIPAVRYFDLTMGSVPESVTIDGKAQPYTWAERIQLQQDTFDARKTGIEALTVSSLYTGADDAEKLALIKEVTRKANEWAKAGRPAAEMREYPTALEQRRQYKDIEPQITKRTPEQIRQAADFARMKNDIAQTLPPGKNRADYALRMAAEKDPKGYEQYALRMYIEKKIGKQLTMLKQDFWAKHPLLQKFFSDAPAQVPAKAAS